MIIECPNCHTNYEVGNSLPPEGRNVRCAACNHVWLAKPDYSLVTTPLASTESPAVSRKDINPPPDLSKEAGKITSESDDAEATRSVSGPDFLRDYESPERYIANPDERRDQYFDETRNQITGIPPINPGKNGTGPEMPDAGGTPNGVSPIHSIISNGHDLTPNRPDPTSIGNRIEKEIGEISSGEEVSQLPRISTSKFTFFTWITVLSAMIGALLFAFTNPNQTAMTLPATVGIFDALGIKTNSRGLVIDSVHYELTTLDNHSAIEVSGVVHNITSAAIKVPSVVIELRDKDDLILFIWATEVTPRNLVAQAQAPFDVTIPAPTKLVRKIKLRFSTRP